MPIEASAALQVADVNVSVPINGVNYDKLDKVSFALGLEPEQLLSNYINMQLAQLDMKQLDV